MAESETLKMGKILSFLKRWSRNFAGIAFLIAAFRVAFSILMAVNGGEFVTETLVRNSTTGAVEFAVLSGVFFILFLLFWLIEIVVSPSVVSKLSSESRFVFKGLQWLPRKSWELLLNLISKISRLIRPKFGKVGKDIRSALAGEYNTVGSPLLKPEPHAQPQEQELVNEEETATEQTFQIDEGITKAEEENPKHRRWGRLIIMLGCGVVLLGGLTSTAIFKYEEYLAKEEIRKNWASVPTNFNGIEPGMTKAEASAMWKAIMSEGFDWNEASFREVTAHSASLTIEEAEWNENWGHYDIRLTGSDPEVVLTGDAPDDLRVSMIVTVQWSSKIPLKNMIYYNKSRVQKDYGEPSWTDDVADWWFYCTERPFGFFFEYDEVEAVAILSTEFATKHGACPS